MIRKFLISLSLLLCLLNLNAQTEPLLLYKASQDVECKQWVDSVFNKLSLKEKVGQLFIHTIAPLESQANINNLKNAVSTNKVGGLLFSGGVLENQARLINLAQEEAKVPLMITFDGEWGLSMRLKDTPVYPRNMVLGCIQDDKLIYEYGQEIARQCRELGVHVNFAPVADVNINPRNPVINTRSFGEIPKDVADKVISYSLGLESGGVLSVSKHFPGHGDTDVDSHHALPVLSFPRARLDTVELYPFKEAINAGVSGMMVGHLEVPALESTKGVPASLSRAITHNLLVEELGFQGLIFTDALEMKGVASFKNVSLDALKAGHHMVLARRNLKAEIDAVLEAVKKGEITETDIDQKCKKVLTYKYILGVADQGKIQISGLSNRINTQNARELAIRLKVGALTVLSNKNGVLPIDKDVKEVAVINVGNGSTFNQTLKKHATPTIFDLKANMPAAERKALHSKLAAFKRIIVNINERQLAPYQAFFAEFAKEAQVIYVCFIPMKQLTQIEVPLYNAAGVILCHVNDRDIQEYTANAVFGEATINGRLSASIGNAFKAGVGYTIPTKPQVYIPEEYGLSSKVLQNIDSIVSKGIKEGAFPGAQVVILKNGKAMYDKAFGTFTTDSKSTAVTPESIYDIASLTKTSATLLAVMKLYDKGLFNLSDKISKHLEYFTGTDKEDITIRELLYHQSGLPSSIAFYQRAIDKSSYPGRLLRQGSDELHTAQIDAKMYGQPNFKFIKGLTSSKPDNEHPLQVSENLWLSKAFSDTVVNTIKEAKLGDKRYRYSCVGFVVLQKLVEKLSGMSLDDYLMKEFYNPMKLTHTAFLPLRYFKKDDIVPSATDNFIRKTTLQGYVHDETAAFQGGVSGNAGLFSTARDIAAIHQMILDGGEYNGRRYLSKETCHVFTTDKSKLSHRGLGYNKPDRKNPAKSPCSSSTPWSAYGHTGFTGTGAWVDPDNKIVYVFVSNRTYPEPWNNKLGQMNIRGQIQEVIYKAMK
ncbi:glycoside hydrolase family 3 N-terminal domain-containing protein [Bacteroides sp. 519]|uniref:glycoside hydrolase family 3 N-terminal domain-containing protein n=1 Tax=Bacteroides sp. 519 TaxID=2302937 RepID=UPI0013D495D6|nr:glycoside hydrolase family 3 N-terminal domain-containing protein [Bacteroides sp. 519]NDV59904.1 beta-N-acetylglucosaminidase [Bacteroides sp. 519]